MMALQRPKHMIIQRCQVRTMRWMRQYFPLISLKPFGGQFGRVGCCIVLLQGHSAPQISWSLASQCLPQSVQSFTVTDSIDWLSSRQNVQQNDPLWVPENTSHDLGSWMLNFEFLGCWIFRTQGNRTLDNMITRTYTAWITRTQSLKSWSRTMWGFLARFSKLMFSLFA